MLIVGGCEKSRPYPNVGYRLEKFDAVFTKKSLYHQGFFAVKRREVFILGAKRTVALPNAKHSTLLQGCFLCFCFLFH